MQTTYPANWLELAKGKASTAWLRDFIRDNLPSLISGKQADQEFAAELDRRLNERKLFAPKQQKNYRSNVVRAIKTVAPNHSAIALVQLPTAEYQELSEAQSERLAERRSVFITSEQAEALVQKAQQMISKSEWDEVAAGLAVLTGRRISEILLSDYAPKSDWSLLFKGMAKKKKINLEVEIEIPTLAPAGDVLAAIKKLHRYLGKTDLLKECHGDVHEARKKAYARYSRSVCIECERHFQELIPPRSGREKLYTHVFRAVYATIATHWYCPPQVLPHQYKAEIQGHFKIGRNGQKLPNYSARSNYDDYAIGDGKGNLGGIGVKLGKVPGLEVIGAFK